MRLATTCCLLTLLALTVVGCFSARPTRSRVRELAPDEEISAPRVPLQDSVKQ